MKAYERFLNYVVVRTPSDESNMEHTPSSQCQFELAKILEKEMQELGLADIYLDEYCYLYGKIPATAGLENRPAIAFVAHMDTVADFCDQEIRPVITKNYDGKDLALGDSERVLSPSMFPHLPSLAGRTLITSDGNTILGADDKAAIAEILTLAERLQKENIPHGPVWVVFTPDEEIGMGAAHFNLERCDAKFAYTLDSDAEGAIEYENFNACKATIEIQGVSVHPGAAKDTMINAGLLAMEFHRLLPADDTPRESEGYHGYYHLTDITGDCGSAVLHYLIRDHDSEKFEERKQVVADAVAKINAKWEEGTASLAIREQYRNMADIIADHIHLIENAKTACKRAGIEPSVRAIRGGTDGVTLTFQGLPCPNLGTGGYGFHGPYEHVTVEGMDKCVDIITELVKMYAE